MATNVNVDMARHLARLAEDDGNYSTGFPPGFLDDYWAQVRKALTDAGLDEAAAERAVAEFLEQAPRPRWTIFRRKPQQTAEIILGTGRPTDE